MIQESITILQQYIEEAELIAFFGGAGVSTESGVPDYRSPQGRYTKLEEERIDPKKVMSKQYMMKHPEAFFKGRKKEFSQSRPEPNDAHRYLADLERNGKDVRIITQNVDGLHQKAGSRYVLELHGTNRYWYCMECERRYDFEELQWDAKEVPRCPIENGIVRPAVVYFGEHPDKRILQKSRETIKKADLLLIAGTSLTVNPAKNLIRSFNGDRAVVINKEPIDTGKLEVNLFFQEPVGELFAQLQKE